MSGSGAGLERNYARRVALATWSLPQLSPSLGVSNKGPSIHRRGCPGGETERGRMSISALYSKTCRHTYIHIRVCCDTIISIARPKPSFSHVRMSAGGDPLLAMTTTMTTASMHPSIYPSIYPFVSVLANLNYAGVFPCNRAGLAWRRRPDARARMASGAAAAAAAAAAARALRRRTKICCTIGPKSEPKVGLRSSEASRQGRSHIFMIGRRAMCTGRPAPDGRGGNEHHALELVARWPR